jgi:hypothetical protein
VFARESDTVFWPAIEERPRRPPQLPATYTTSKTRWRVRPRLRNTTAPLIDEVPSGLLEKIPVRGSLSPQAARG